MNSVTKLFETRINTWTLQSKFSIYLRNSKPSIVTLTLIIWTSRTPRMNDVTRKLLYANNVGYMKCMIHFMVCGNFLNTYDI